MKNFKFYLAAAAVVALLPCCNMKHSVDFIGYNGLVYTVDTLFSKAEAFAVKDGLFVEVGSTEEILKKYQSKNKTDFKGAAVYPGFHDAHCHLYEIGSGLLNVDLRNASSYNEILERLKKAYAENPDRTFIIGDGWDQNLWEEKRFPTNKELNELFPAVPVLLNRIDLHAVIANDAAIKKAGLSVNDKTLNRQEAEIVNGQFTGIFMENMCSVLKEAVVNYTPTDIRNIYIAGQKECFKYGLTSICDPGTEYIWLKILDSLVSEGVITLRIDSWLAATAENLEKITAPYRNKNLNVSTIKLFRDGALGSRGALLIEPYSDDKGHCGLEYTSLEKYKADCQWAFEHGFRVSTHCIGDRANREVLDVYATFLKGKNNLGWRIEHAQIIDKSDVDKFGQYSIIPSVQPTHCTSDMLWADERLGTRLKNAYIYKDLLGQLGWIPSGTDAPIESVNPIYTFFAAAYRKNLDFVPEGGFQMENALTKEEALRSMTIWAAKSILEEQVKGSIEAGKYADFVVTDRDFMNLPEREVPQTKVVATYLAGEKVY